MVTGNGGKIISAIMEAGFEISAMQMFTMEKANAEEFYEVYKGVVQEYNAMVNELTAGPSLALEIRAQNAPIAFREMTGPADPVSGVKHDFLSAEPTGKILPWNPKHFHPFLGRIKSLFFHFQSDFCWLLNLHILKHIHMDFTRHPDLFSFDLHKLVPN